MEQEIAGVDEQASFTFQPKDGGPPMVARLTVNPSGSGWDVVLFLDHTGPRVTSDSGWMLEMSANPDGTFSGSITSHSGNDCLAVFVQETPERLSVRDFIVKHAGRGAIVRALYEKES
jgi:hypothetical protein